MMLPHGSTGNDRGADHTGAQTPPVEAGLGPDALKHTVAPQEMLREVVNEEELTQRREAQFPRIFELYRKIDMHPSQSGVPFNPYTNKPGTESFLNVTSHNIQVSHPTEKIMTALQANGEVTDAQTEYAIGRTLLHDAPKPFEIMRKHALKEGLIDDAYSESAYEKLSPILEELGFEPAYLEYLVKAGKETGHLSLAQFLTVNEDDIISLVDGMLPEKVVHLADDMTSTSIPKEGEAPVTKFLTTEERMEASNFKERYPWLWEEGLAIDSEGAIVTIKDIHNPDENIRKVLGSFAEMQVTVAEMICAELQSKIDPESVEDPESFIKGLVNS